MLQEQYKKESNGKSYLLLPKTKETFEEQMIRSVLPKGILCMAKAENEGIYKYEITGRKTLAMTFERVPMTAEQIEKVLQGILDVLECGKEYLLTEDNFVLLPEYIFLGIPTYEVTLCYYPEYGIPFVEQMGKLFEMFLNRVDYREEKAIAMVYALYMQLQEPDMTLEQMREKLTEQTREITGREISRKEPVYEEEETGIKSVKGKEEHYLGDRAAEFEKVKRKKPGIWERIRKEVGTKLVLGPEKTVIMSELPQQIHPASCVMEAPPEWGTQYTRVLSVKKEEAYPALVSVRNGETVQLTKFPFYVGSLPAYMDYVIRAETVSRFHAKFVRQGEDVYIMDLNSTNGTKVNGRMLNVQEQVKLTEKDCITFADVEYYYRNTDGNG